MDTELPKKRLAGLKPPGASTSWALGAPACGLARAVEWHSDVQSCREHAQWHAAADCPCSHVRAATSCFERHAAAVHCSTAQAEALLRQAWPPTATATQQWRHATSGSRQRPVRWQATRLLQRAHCACQVLRAAFCACACDRLSMRTFCVQRLMVGADGTSAGRHPAASPQ
jgi:hypothetical protein